MKLLLLLLGILFLVLGIVALVATGFMGYVLYVPLIVGGLVCLLIRRKLS